MSNITNLFNDETTKIASICGLVVVILILGCTIPICIVYKKRKKHINEENTMWTPSWSSSDENTDINKHENTDIEKHEADLVNAIIDLKNKECKKEMEKDEQYSVQDQLDEIDNLDI
eukprot:69414_1